MKNTCLLNLVFWEKLFYYMWNTHPQASIVKTRQTSAQSPWGRILQWTALHPLQVKRWTRIVGKGGLWVMSFINKCETSTTYHLNETTQHFVLINKLCLWVQSAFTHNLPLPTTCLYPQSAFTHNPSTTKSNTHRHLKKPLILPACSAI